MRIERDSMGEMAVPDTALWGASTQRAVQNFPISSLRLPLRFIQALGIIKVAAARANTELGILDKERGEAIAKAGEEVIDGSLYTHFVVDLFQTGSGTSTNMNANEVIARRAIDILGQPSQGGAFIHPNDHVNMCQSSNDLFPSAIHIAAHEGITKQLVPKLRELHEVLLGKSAEFKGVLKAGRTHLQDAIPMTLGQEFGGYASQVRHAEERIFQSSANLLSLALGGTAVGTGLNAEPRFAKTAIAEIARLTGSYYVEAENHFEAQGAQDTAVEVSGQLRGLATVLMKIADDIRWLASGPRCGLAEIYLPAIQPGSSSMPAKVNPVICESTMMACAQVIGNDATVAIAAQRGNFELNTMMPVLAYNLLESIELLGSVATNFAKRCISGIVADEAQCRAYAEQSLATVTALAPLVGHDRSAEVAARAVESGKSVREVARETKILPDSELTQALDLMKMTQPGRRGETDHLASGS